MNTIFKESSPPKQTSMEITKDEINPQETSTNSQNILNKYKIKKVQKHESEKSECTKKNVTINDRSLDYIEFINGKEDTKLLNKSADIPKIGDNENENENENEFIVTISNKKKIKKFKQSNLLIAAGTAGMVVHNGIINVFMKGKQPFIITSIKNAYCIYDAHKLRKAYASEYFKEEIKNLCVHKGFVYVVFNQYIYKINEYGKKKVFPKKHKYPICNIVVVDDYVLSYSKKEIIVWNNEKEYENSKEHDDISCNGDSISDGSESDSEYVYEQKVHKIVTLFDEYSDTEIRKVIHPRGYMNKIIISTNKNKLYLYNINKEKIIHEFTALNQLALHDMNQIKILAHSNKNEELCVLTNSNELYIIHIEKDEIVFSKNIFMKDDKISCLDFFHYEYSGSMQVALIAGTEHGKMIMMNLVNNQYFILREVHDHVKKIITALNGNVYTVGNDNTIHLLGVNIQSFSLQIMKTRSGCKGIVQNIIYADEEEHKLLVSANKKETKEGNLCIISPHMPEQNKEFAWSKKLHLINKRIIDFAINYNRHYDWNNIVVCLEKNHRVYLGSSFRKTISEEYLALPFPSDSNEMKKEKKEDKEIEKGKNVSYNKKSIEEDCKIYDKEKIQDQASSHESQFALSVLLSTCGHVAIVGYNNGEIHSFNVQSTQHRNEFKTNRYSLKSKAHIGGHILKLYLYDTNYFISACNSKRDTTIRVWNIYTSQLVYSYDVKQIYQEEEKESTKDSMNIKSLEKKKDQDFYIQFIYHHDILTTVGLSNGETLILDIEQKSITRKFKFKYAISNVLFSKDNRLIFFALKNKSLLVYELISNTFIDYLLFKNNVIAMIYNDIHLYTAHENSSNFVYAWTNKNVYHKQNSLMGYSEFCQGVEMEVNSEEEEEEKEEQMNGNNTNKKRPNVSELLQDDKEKEEPGKKEEEEKLTKGNANESIMKYNENNFEQLRQTYQSSEKQIDTHLLTLSGVHISKIAYLIFLDKIKENCRVVENVKKNEEIPFFLSLKMDEKMNKEIEYVDKEENEFLKNIREDLIEDEIENEMKENEEEVEEQKEEQEKQRESEKKKKKEKLKSKHITITQHADIHLSKLQELLAKHEESYTEILDYLKTQSPSGVHYNILSLNTKKEMEQMIYFFIYHVKSKDNIDLIQAYIMIFLRAHGKKMLKTKTKTLINAKNELLQEIQKNWESMNSLFENIIFFIKFFTNIQLE